MDREILFRGKRQDGVWFEGSLLQYKVEKPSRTENHYKIQEFNYGYSDDELINQEYMSGFDEEVIPETVGQFTGLTDKNGKKIFEGDCIGCKENVVEYYDGTFTINGDRPLSWLKGSKDFIVVGNIYEG